MIETNTDYTYVNLYASSLSDLNKILVIKPTIQTLKENEIIITKSLSEKYNININDSITLLIGREKLLFKVTEILPDNNLFSNLSVFIDKNNNAQIFLNTLGLGALPPIVFQNIYNRVYFSLQDKHDKADIITQIETLYPQQIVKATVNQQYIEDTVVKYGSLIFLIMTLILFIVLLLLQSTFSLVFEDRKQQIAVIDILGGRKSFTLLSLLVEFLMYYLPSFFISIFLTNVVINTGLKYIGTNITYQLHINNIITGLCLSFCVILLIEIYNYLNISRSSLIKLSKVNYSFSLSSTKFTFGIFSLSIIVFILNHSFLKHVIDIKIYYLLNTLIAFIVAIVFLTC